MVVKSVYISIFLRRFFSRHSEIIIWFMSKNYTRSYTMRLLYKNETSCYEQVRIKICYFVELYNILGNVGGLHIDEQVSMILYTLAHLGK